MLIKATFSVICKTFLKFHNKLHNMKALVILSHHDHHFSHLLIFPVSSSGLFSREKTRHSSLFQHRGSHRDLSQISRNTLFYLTSLKKESTFYCSC